jgi:type VI secretion system protein VasL
MSHILYIENDRFILNPLPEFLTSHSCYQKLKRELHRKITPLSGGIDWPLVVEECHLIGKEIGLDVEIAIYLSVGGIKVSGLSGFGDGLELLYASLSVHQKGRDRNIREVESLLRWANKQVLKELEDVRTSYEVLRDLYRIERLCERISYLLIHQFDQSSLDFESIGYAIFEHIDAIETSYQAVLKRENIDIPVMNLVAKKKDVVHVCRKRRMLGAYLAGVVTSGLVIWSFL